MSIWPCSKPPLRERVAVLHGLERCPPAKGRGQAQPRQGAVQADPGEGRAVAGQKYLRAQHDIVDSALRERPNPCFPQLSAKSRRERPSRGRGAGGSSTAVSRCTSPPIHSESRGHAPPWPAGMKVKMHGGSTSSSLVYAIEDAATDEASFVHFSAVLTATTLASTCGDEKGLLEIGVSASSNEVQGLLMESITVKMDCARTKSSSNSVPDRRFWDGRARSTHISRVLSSVALLSEKLRSMIEKVYRDESDFDAYFRALIAIVRVSYEIRVSAHLRNLV